MKALVLAAGVGSRLKPWTDSHPKALVEVGGKPMLRRVVENIVAAGIDDIVVNVHHFASQIVDYISANDFHARISISDESGRLLDTGGAIRKACPLFGSETVLVHNADILTDMPLEVLIDRHRKSEAEATLLVAGRDSARRLVFDDMMSLRGWTNLDSGQVKPATLKYDRDSSRLRSFNGVHILESSLYLRTLDYAQAETPFSIIDFYISNCGQCDIRGFDMPRQYGWWDVGKPAVLEQVRQIMQRK